MKKILNLLAITLLSLFTLTTFPSCDDDDNSSGGNVNEADLIGHWQITHTTGWEKYDGKISDSWDENMSDIMYQIKSDGNIIEFYNEKKNGSGEWYTKVIYKWSFDGSIFTIIDNRFRPAETTSFKILKLSKTTLVLEMHDKGGDSEGNWEVYEKGSFRRINIED